MSLWTKVRGIVAPVALAAIPGVGPALAATYKLGAPMYAANRASRMNPPAGPGGWGVIGPGMTETAAQGGAVAAIGRGAAMGYRWLIGARGIARNAMGKIVGVMRGESLFRNKRVIALAKQIGIQGAAVALGITIAEVAEMFVAESGKRRRVRGITGRDIRCTRRTLGKIRSVQRMIGIARPPSRARGRPAVAVRCD